ncbi:hypothetical protein PF005_g5748 [Phytophthora fragariae]|uniref:Uncharacterized protein n=1 Tax=Phytophthora fragariae TaxID=53985 RepID=A0A6A4A1J9_9STRA|nr:hypothetical protein PF003_g39787 [Phytophthora fragariae]KAE9224864.1 hypothetical protein PF005_g5748 [Phytophthora fragariae]KAE9246882.1 hypothetical protein PF002_g6551 [Phytophthora fragariae]
MVVAASHGSKFNAIEDAEEEETGWRTADRRPPTMTAAPATRVAVAIPATTPTVAVTMTIQMAAPATTVATTRAVHRVAVGDDAELEANARVDAV